MPFLADNFGLYTARAINEPETPCRSAQQARKITSSDAGGCQIGYFFFSIGNCLRSRPLFIILFIVFIIFFISANCFSSWFTS